MAYTKYPRGSEWRKWDLHMHTPETRKNDNFIGSSPAEKWKKYIDTINASTEEITVIGITDYLSTDNYFKFKRYWQDGSITKKVEFILPNVELRVLPVTGSSTPVNLHCIFNPTIDKELEARFFSKLKFTYDRDYSALPEELRQLGRSMPGKASLDDASALKEGISQYVIEVSVLRNLFKNDKVLRDNTIIVVSNKSNDGLSGTTQHADFFEDKGSQLDATRWSIYQLSDAIFSSSEKDVLYFAGTGVDTKEVVIEKCKTLMPCFHGCDAHTNDKIFKPDKNRFCWVKADPTFEGLKQTLYEPEDRVKIQAYQPDIKNERFIISEVEFIDSGNLFGNQKILLNENLNAIIGGKSSGKSLLLYSAARSIDPEQVDKTSNRLKFEGYKLPGNFDFKVTWKNKETDFLKETTGKNHKIIYIPQLYINHLVEKNNKDDLNILIENILLQDMEFKSFYDETIENIEKTTSDIDLLLSQYLQTRLKILDVQQKSKDLGKAESIKKGMDGLKLAIDAGRKSSNLTEEEFKKYNLLIEQKALSEKRSNDVRLKETSFDTIIDETIKSRHELLGNTAEADGIPLKGKIDRILDQFTTIPPDVQGIVDGIQADFSLLINHLKENVNGLNLEKQKEIELKEKEKITGLLKPYMEKIAGQQELQKLTVQLQNELLKVEQAESLEKQLSTLVVDYTNIRSKIVVLLNNRFKYYLLLQKKINDTRSDIGTGITLNCSVLFKQEDLPLYEQANKAAISTDSVFNDLFKNGMLIYEELLKLSAKLLRVIDNKLVLDNEGKITIPLKQKTTLEEILRGLLVDSFKLDYTVTYKGDDLLSMSPGKKGTVLLILFLQISSSEFPIFIDQPEDNLDNRTIYDLLCKMIKLKKKDRQIVIVSHNANLVIATDSENIIVANQEGQDSASTTTRNRFEYVNGSLEHTFPKNEKIKEILKQQGIKEHACDILEGGDEAFKQRERKYAIK
ncbi:TrlF family AAA-like ATPase [Mucilaginibacter sp. NFX135]|uniref:TrlF family AAA-like ATPase n=1 Tax=Mucilaginibacter sp. NFX135 TaxID=3402687 RepID=UPI003AFB11D8